MTETQTKPRLAFTKGRKFRVIKEGAQLQGMQPILGGQRGWSKKLAVGDVLTCAGEKWTFGDGVPIIQWLDENGNYIANDCEFRPSTGGMWNSRPNAEYLEDVEKT